ncbi:hypothetical protein [Kitasatospora sp. NPDC094015]|uniref:hypothetical protein n=1 Tax=Kitasatospora sp. NPDC094015 TaxID=3155205 RepID=UPI003332C470
MRGRGQRPAAAAAVTVLALCSAAGWSAPAAFAEDGPAAAGTDTAPQDAPAIARGCGPQYACEFRILPGLSREFTTAVVSVGNAAVNCTDRAIDVYRTVVLESSTTDNIGGEISGSATLSGTIDNTTDVSAGASGSNKTEITHTDHTAPTDKGPNADIANGATLAVGGSVSGAAQLKLSATATFALAFRATYSHEWRRSSTESTQVKFTVQPNDELQFGVLNAMTRTVGELRVDGLGKLIKNVIVDSPSSVNVSTVVAQTFSATDRCLSLRPPGRSAPAGLTEAAPRADGARPTARLRAAADGSWLPLD